MRLAFCVIAAVILASCGGNNMENKEAVRKGVVDYLEKRKTQTGLDLSLMNLEVANVTFDKNEARATVRFIPKDTAKGGAGMAMSYVLERRGSEWVVKGRQESGAGHSGGMMPPSGAMPGDTPVGQLPPGHPPAGGESKGEAPAKK